MELITNGSFEDGGFDPGDVPLVMVLRSNLNAGVIDHWRIIRGEVLWVENGNKYGVTTGDGKRFLDLTGYRDEQLPREFGTIQQDIDTKVGRIYEFSMSLGTREDHSRFAGPITVGFATRLFMSAGTGQAFQFVHDPGSDPTKVGIQWATYSGEFMATEPRTAITIWGVDGIAYVGLDRVSVRPKTFVRYLTEILVRVFPLVGTIRPGR